MQGALHPPVPRAGVTFELERFELEDGWLVVEGLWSGVRGMRFMRPTLVVDDRPRLATLEHKPWAPTDGDPWTAAFPWDGPIEPDPATALLTVAPSVTVHLAGGGTLAQPLGLEGQAPQSDLSRKPAAAEPADIGDPAPKTPSDDAVPQPLGLGGLAPESQMLRERDEERRLRVAAEHDRDRAFDQLDEAVRDREAAVRTRARMEARAEEADRARAAAEAQRDRALQALAEARAQRDEVLVAHRALQRHLERRPEPAAAPEPQPDPTPQPDPPVATEPAAPLEDEEPIGVRVLPAARAVAPELEPQRPLRMSDLGGFDLWAMRIFGVIAAVAFILLMATLLAAFL